MTGKISGLRILMVAARYFPYMGGIETHIHEVGKRLVRDGVEVTVLTTMPSANTSSASLPRHDIVEGMRIIRVKAWPPQRDYYIAPEMYATIKRGRWDIVHCQGCHTFVPPLAMLAAKEAKLPYIVTLHTGGHSSGFRNSIRSIQWQLQRPLLANALKLIGVSHFEANYFRDRLHIPAKRFSVIPNGAAALSGAAQCSIEGPTQSLIVSVGRLERYKGHQHLITALPQVREQRPDARLLILGKGPYEATLRELAQKVGVAKYVDIQAVPAHDRQAMADILSRASLVTLFSEYEAHPIAVMEALALRRPVLVANTSGMRELAEQGLVCAIPLDSTPSEIAQAAVQQIDEPLAIPTHFSLPTWDDCAQQLQTVYTMSARRELCVS